MLLNRHSCFLFVVKFVFLVDFKHIANTQNKMSSLSVMTMVSAVVVFYFGEFQTHRIYGAGMANLAKKALCQILLMKRMRRLFLGDVLWLFCITRF